jgi:hypothetical protein
VTATITRATGRPASSPESLEHERITRIGALAISILKCMRSDPSRSRYRSERELRGWLAEDQIQHTTEDIKPALALLEASGLLVRDRAGLGRPGQATSLQNQTRAPRALTATE